jgi:hypothetical protein
MVNLESNLDVELGALLDGERLILEAVDRAGGGEIDHDVGPALDFQSQGLDDALAWVIGLVNGIATVETERGFPAVHGLIVLVYWRGKNGVLVGEDSGQSMDVA